MPFACLPVTLSAGVTVEPGCWGESSPPALRAAVGDQSHVASPWSDQPQPGSSGPPVLSHCVGRPPQLACSCCMTQMSILALVSQ